MIRVRSWLLLGAVLAASLDSPLWAQQGIRWQPALETAKRVAGQTNRPVLVHFWAEWCQPCAEMERNVFSRPDVAAAIEAGFVPVKVNVDYFPATVRQYGVSIVPTDVVITADGQLVDKLIGLADCTQYVARLNQIAQSRSPQASSQAATTGQPEPGGYQQPALGSYQPSGYQAPTYEANAPFGNAAAEQPQQSGDRYQEYFNRQSRPEAASPRPPYADQWAAPTAKPPADPVAQQTPSYQIPTSPYQGAASSGVAASPYDAAATAPYQRGPYGEYRRDSAADPSWQSPSAEASTGVPSSPASEPSLADQLPPGSPPLALEGFCPVRLAEEERWVRGDVRWGARHEGRTFLFAGPEEQQRFLASPEKYAPVLAGNDVVLAVEQGQMIPGRREYGAWYQGKVYLFSSESSYNQFNSNPGQYIESLQQSAPGMARRPVGSPSAGGAWQTYGSPYGGRY
jgi:YHS domain-containing protein/thiol-disulfide isomerase/thioredoxin